MTLQAMRCRASAHEPRRPHRTRCGRAKIRAGGGWRARQRGIALVLALFIVAFATAIATGMLFTTERELRRASNLYHAEQIQQYGISAERFASAALELHRQTKDSDDQLDLWYTTPLIAPLEGGGIAGTIRDSQGCFNVNSLVDAAGQPREKQIEQYKRLLRILELPEDLAAVARDWQDPDNIAELGGAEDDSYLGRSPPYRAANAKFRSPTELQLLQGYTAEVVETLQPHVCTLPVVQVPINVNFATPPVLQSLHEDIDETIAAELALQVEEIPMAKLEDFTEHSLLEGIELTAADVSVHSDFYIATMEITVGQLAVNLQSLLQRARGKVRVIDRARGAL